MIERIEWRDVAGYEGLYEVSSDGQVRTHKSKTTYTALHGKRKWKQRYLSKKVDKNGYFRVDLWKDGKPRTWLVHRLVALTFIEQPDGKNIVNHLDGNPSNNHVSNLEWCTCKENINHAFDNRLIETGKITVVKDRDSGKIYEFRSMTEASLFIGKNKGYISDQIGKGRTNSGNYIFEVK